jgi:trimeric autotransporter adhesin
MKPVRTNAMKARCLAFSLLFLGSISSALLSGCGTRVPMFETISNPSISVSTGSRSLPNSLGSFDFSSVKVNTSKTVNITVENRGGAALSIAGIALVQGESGAFSKNLTEIRSPVEAMGTTSFSISFSPTKTGADSATIRIESDDPDDGVYTFNVTGHGEANLSVTHGGVDIPHGSGAYDFGGVIWGFSSAPETFSLVNGGTEYLSITDIFLASGDASHFIIDETAVAPSLAPGESTSFSLAFAPGGTGWKSAVVEIKFLNPGENSYTFTVTGTGQTPLPEMQLSQGAEELPDGSGSFEFGNVINGQQSQPAVFTIKNSGSAPLSLTYISSSDPAVFVTDGSGMSGLLQPGETTAFEVAFKPSGVGAKAETITVRNNDPDEDPYTFQVRGTGVPAPAPEINVRRGSMNVPTGTQGHNFGAVVLTFPPPQVTFTMQNLGNADLQVSGVTLTPGAFILGLSATPPFAVTPGSSRTFTVTFAPSSPGGLTASVSIASNDSDESLYTFTLTGTGVPPSPEINIKRGTVSITDGALGHNFGDLESGVTSQPVVFTVENTGTSNLFINDLYITPGRFSIENSSTASVVPPGSSTSFTVTFAPDAQGEHTGTVTLRSNDADEDPYTFTVKGTGLLPPNVKISVKDGPSTISNGGTYDFGDVSTGSSSSVALTIENGGVSSLEIINILLTDGDIGAFSRDISATQFTVPPGGATAFSVTFTPVTDASCQRNLEINNNDSQNSTYIITFKGRGMD